MTPRHRGGRRVALVRRLEELEGAAPAPVETLTPSEYDAWCDANAIERGTVLVGDRNFIALPPLDDDGEP